MEIWTAFVIGLVGSLHCIGMCGPIVIALPGRNASRLRFLAGRLVYNAGRVISYTLLGLLAGLLGAGVRMAGFQRWLSIALGVLILLAVILPSRITSRFFPAGLWTVINVHSRKLWQRLFARHTTGSLLLIGFLNGFLPCGLVYAAMAGAASTGSIPSGMVYMAVFGLGTFPVMLATALAGKFLTLAIRNSLHRLIPVGAMVLASLLILRGLSLGIPYVSPKMMTTENNGQQTVDFECCQ